MKYSESTVTCKICCFQRLKFKNLCTIFSSCSSTSFNMQLSRTCSQLFNRGNIWVTGWLLSSSSFNCWFFPSCHLLSSCRGCGPWASSLSVQPVHPGLEPASSPVRHSGEERLAAEAHRGAGGGAQLPALSAWPFNRQHEESRGWGSIWHVCLFVCLFRFNLKKIIFKKSSSWTAWGENT